MGSKGGRPGMPMNLNSPNVNRLRTIPANSLGASQRTVQLSTTNSSVISVTVWDAAGSGPLDRLVGWLHFGWFSGVAGGVTLDAMGGLSILYGVEYCYEGVPGAMMQDNITTAARSDRLRLGFMLRPIDFRAGYQYRFKEFW